MKKYISLTVVVLMLFMAGCAGYQYKPVPFRAPESYPNHASAFGAVIAGRAWVDPTGAREAFGFDIRGAGLTPVQIVVDNKGDNTLRVVPDQTMLLDAEGNYWNILPANVAYNRIDEHVQYERMAGEGARTGLLYGVAGAIIGAAVGIVSGGHVGEAAGNGAVIGAAAGAVLGGMQGLGDPESKAQIGEDLRNRTLKDRPLAAHEISHGFLFFPGEVTSASVLRLRLRNDTNGEDTIIELPMPTGAQ